MPIKVGMTYIVVTLSLFTLHIFEIMGFDYNYFRKVDMTYIVVTPSLFILHSFEKMGIDYKYFRNSLKSIGFGGGGGGMHVLP